MVQIWFSLIWTQALRSARTSIHTWLHIYSFYPKLWHRLAVVKNIKIIFFFWIYTSLYKAYMILTFLWLDVSMTCQAWLGGPCYPKTNAESRLCQWPVFVCLSSRTNSRYGFIIPTWIQELIVHVVHVVHPNFNMLFLGFLSVLSIQNHIIVWLSSKILKSLLLVLALVLLNLYY